MEEMLQLDRPLTADIVADYVKKWFDNELSKRTFVTRSAHYKLLHRKTSAVIRVIRTLSPRNDVMLEATVRSKISQKCVI